MAIIHEYSINLGPGHFGPWRRLSYSIYEKKSKKEVNEFLRVKMGEPYPTIFLITDRDNERTAFVLENRQLMQLFGENAILAVETIACMPFTKGELIETINQKVYTKFLNTKTKKVEKEDDFDPLPELDVDNIF